MRRIHNGVLTDLSQRLTAGFLITAMAALLFTGTPFFPFHTVLRGIYTNPSDTTDIVLNMPSEFGTGYTFNQAVITIHTAGQYRLRMAGVGDGFPVQVDARAGNVALTLENAQIVSHDIPALSCQNSLTVLRLSGFSTLSGGVYLSAGTQCIVYGPGALQAEGIPGAAGIGGDKDLEGGSLRIEGGSITAIGGTGAAGIGGGSGIRGGKMRKIEIAGGTVTATGGPSGGAGIGGGAGVLSGASGGEILVGGGNVTAMGTGGGAGIGGAVTGDGGSILISAGTVNATGRNGGAGIGGGGGTDGSGGAGGQISITGGTVHAESLMGYGAGVGGGEYGPGGRIQISGGQVTAAGGYDLYLRKKQKGTRDASIPGGAGIGGGFRGPGADVLVTGAATTVEAEGGNDAYDLGSGMGSSDGGKLRLEGGATIQLLMTGTNAEILEEEKLLLRDGVILGEDSPLSGRYRDGRKQVSIITLLAQPDTAPAGTAFTFTAVLEGGVLSWAGGHIYPRGTVTFYADGVPIGEEAAYDPIENTFKAAWTPASVGSIKVTAVYAPDAEMDYVACEDGVVGEEEIFVETGLTEQDAPQQPPDDSAMAEIQPPAEIGENLRQAVPDVA